MKFPWTRREETRADQSYTDVVVHALLAAATGDVVSGLTAGVEIAAGHWQRAFASAELTPQGPVADVLTPHLGFIGRALLHRGEAVFEVAVVDGRLTLIPASSFTITGGPTPSEWMYQLTLAGPSEAITRTLSSGRVLHLFYAQSAASPWKGVSPIEAAGTSRTLLANLETRLAQEIGQSVGSLIPVPNVQSSDQLQTDIRKLKGQVTLVESMSKDWGEGQAGAPAGDYQVRRIGANPPDVLRALRREVEESILGSAGVPITALSGGQGTASREAFRQFLHLTIMPVASELAAQVQRFFELPTFSFSFDRLMASDLSGRARAFQSLINGGMDLTKAAALAGLMEPQE